nr:MAG TPA: hypothetical protein [Caudoviricetes sp.]
MRLEVIAPGMHSHPMQIYKIFQYLQTKRQKK